MPYKLGDLCDADIVDQEFDTLDRDLERDKGDEVLRACEEILCDACKVPTLASPRKVSWAHLLAGTVKLRNSNHQEALYHFQRASALPPLLRPRAVAGMAMALAQANRTDEALSMLTEYLSGDVSSWHLWEALGQCLRKKDDDSGAWEAFVRALQLNPSSSSVIGSLVDLGFNTNRHAALSEALQLHLSSEPLALDARAYLAACLLLMGNLERGAAEVRRLEAFAPFTPMTPELFITVQNLLSTLTEKRASQSI